MAGVGELACTYAALILQDDGSSSLPQIWRFAVQVVVVELWLLLPLRQPEVTLVPPLIQLPRRRRRRQRKRVMMTWVSVCSIRVFYECFPYLWDLLVLCLDKEFVYVAI